MNNAVNCFVLIAAGLVYAQKAPTPTPTPAPVTPTRPVGTTNTNTLPNNTTNNPSTINTQPINRPIYLSGKVVLQDGTPPPDLVKIERICGGNPRKNGADIFKAIHFAITQTAPQAETFKNLQFAGESPTVHRSCQLAVSLVNHFLRPNANQNNSILFSENPMQIFELLQ